MDFTKDLLRFSNLSGFINYINTRLCFPFGYLLSFTKLYPKYKQTTKPHYAIPLPVGHRVTVCLDENYKIVGFGSNILNLGIGMLVAQLYNSHPKLFSSKPAYKPIYWVTAIITTSRVPDVGAVTPISTVDVISESAKKYDVNLILLLPTNIDPKGDEYTGARKWFSKMRNQGYSCSVLLNYTFDELEELKSYHHFGSDIATNIHPYELDGMVITTDTEYGDFHTLPNEYSPIAFIEYSGY